MAAKKGKTKSAKVSGLKSKKLTADQAGQVKGGFGDLIGLPHKDMLSHKDMQVPGGVNFRPRPISTDVHIK